MAESVYITKIAKREFQYRGGITLEIPYFDNGQNEWYKEHYKKTKFTLPDIKHEGLYYQLCLAIKQKDKSAIDKILPELENHCIKSHDQKTDVEKWADMAVQLPGDWGPVGKNKNRLKDIITNRSYGRVLEAMCGFNSYFGESDRISEVVVSDFCEEALERYNYPERTRILYDLERVVNGEGMNFFGDSSFQTIGVFFAIDYLTNPIPVHKEFYRILSKNGQLLIAGGTTQGYRDMLKRMFDPEDCSKSMKSAGFSTKTEHLSLKTKFEFGEYYLVEGRK